MIMGDDRPQSIQAEAPLDRAACQTMVAVMTIDLVVLA